MVSEAFGKTFVDTTLAPTTTGTTTNNLRFPGQYEDVETATHYNYFRDYDPTTGRYVQSDPIGLIAGVNTFVYVFGQSTKRVDPRGLCVFMGWYPSTEMTEFKSNTNSKIVFTAKFPGADWTTPNCVLPELFPPLQSPPVPTPQGPMPGPSSFRWPWKPPCLPRIYLQTWDLWKTTFEQSSRTYEVGYYLTVCPPVDCNDDGIQKQWDKRLKSDWKVDFTRTSYDWLKREPEQGR
jgi:RHS repeat-associated protein